MRIPSNFIFIVLESRLCFYLLGSNIWFKWFWILVASIASNHLCYSCECILLILLKALWKYRTRMVLSCEKNSSTFNQHSSRHDWSRIYHKSLVNSTFSKKKSWFTIGLSNVNDFRFYIIRPAVVNHLWPYLLKWHYLYIIRQWIRYFLQNDSQEKMFPWWRSGKLSFLIDSLAIWRNEWFKAFFWVR